MESPKKKPERRMGKPAAGENQAPLASSFPPLTGELLKYAQEREKEEANEESEPPMTDNEFWEQTRRNEADLKTRREPHE